jgi:alanyl-tRNA synthetase
MMLFGESTAGRSVVDIGGWSVELCSRTHVVTAEMWV